MDSLEHLNGCLPHIPRRPGRIDNSELILYGTEEEGDGLTLRRNLQEGQDYTLVPQEVWKKLHEWYLFLDTHFLNQIFFTCDDHFCFKIFFAEISPTS